MIAVNHHLKKPKSELITRSFIVTKTEFLPTIEGCKSETFSFRRKKRIIFTYYNGFTGEFLGSLETNYSPIDSAFGKYTRHWKRMKKFLANEYKLDAHWVRLRVNFTF